MSSVQRVDRPGSLRGAPAQSRAVRFSLSIHKLERLHVPVRVLVAILGEGNRRDNVEEGAMRKQRIRSVKENCSSVRLAEAPRGGGSTPAPPYGMAGPFPVRGGGGRVEPRLALLAGVVHADRLPNVAIGAGCLDQIGVAAEACKRVTRMLALEVVCVVLAHVADRLSPWFLGLVVLAVRCWQVGGFR